MHHMRLGARHFVWMLGAIALGGCVTLPTTPPPPANELITYETMPGPFCGRCDTMKFAAASDGRVWVERGHWESSYSDWQVERYEVVRSPAEYAQFRVLIAPYRPPGELTLDDPSPQCSSFMTDLGEVAVTWRGGGTDAYLRYNYGCDPEKRAAMAEVLRSAPSILRIDLIWTAPLATSRAR